jgi:hypothetical protein
MAIFLIDVSQSFYEQFSVVTRRIRYYNRATMLHKLKLLLAVFAALCLPLHALAAATMPICQLAAAQSMGSDCDMPQHQNSGSSPVSCKHCGICHLAGAGMIAVTLPSNEATPAASVHSLTPLLAYQSRHIEPLQKPPRLS